MEDANVEHSKPTMMCECVAAPGSHLIVRFQGHFGDKRIIKCRKFTIEQVVDGDGNVMDFSHDAQRSVVAERPAVAEPPGDGQQARR